MNTIVKARAIIIKDHKIFLVKDTRCNMFILPGGTQEEGETVEETFYREIIEELGVTPVLEKFIGFREYINMNLQNSIQFIFKVKNVDSFLKIDKKNCSHGYEWSEAGFYDIKDIKNKNMDIPEDLEEIFYCTLFNKKYEYFL